MKKVTNKTLIIKEENKNILQLSVKEEGRGSEPC